MHNNIMDKPVYNPDTFFNWLELEVRFRDLDPLRHVNNSVFNSYFEEARIQFIGQIPEFDHSVQQGKSFVLVHISIDYIKPILYGETILVGSAMKELGNSSINGFQAIYAKETKELKAVAESTGVWFDLKKNRPIRLPEIHNPEDYLYKG